MLEIDVRRRLGDFTVEAAFKAPAGITALFGRSGAGKTSIVDMIAGLTRPDSGRIAIDGDLLFDADGAVDVPPERRRLAYVFQESRLFPHLTVAGNLNFGMRLLPAAARRLDMDQVVALLDIDHLLRRRPRNLSAGERQRVAIGRALLTSPRLLLMDEPLANLDAARRAEILPFIERLRDEFGIAIVYVSHNMDEVVRLADTVALISDGRVAAIGPVPDIMSRLDLRPLTGRWEAGAVLEARVAGHDAADGLTRLAFAGGDFWVPRIELAEGHRLRIRVRARDVSLALRKPERISVLNVFKGRVVELGRDDGPQVDVLVDVGGLIWARVTRRSVAHLDLRPGSEVYALVKAVAVDRDSLGGRGGPGGFRR